jgi:phenylpropionate dioxygenase-like ring-hydroxylating dioxygenase large terminal subunit
MPVATDQRTIDIHSLIKTDRVHGSVYRDSAIFEQELEQIFGRVWVYLAHESEIPENGSYVRRQIGLQPVIVVRGDDGAVRVFFNRCRHRANLVCNHPAGIAKTLRCAYHGWTYANTGELVAPTFDEAYEDGLDEREFGLTPLPRVGIYRGLIFASAAAEGISLDEHLGNAREFLDLIIDRSPAGEMSLTAGTQKMRYLANWKMLPENSVEGSYHGHFIHKFAFDLFDRLSGRDRMNSEEQCVRYLSGGHMVQDFRSVQFRPRGEESPLQVEYADKLAAVYGKERAQDLMFDKTPILFVFPNLLFVQTHIRRMQPVSVDETLVYYQPGMLKDAPPEINEQILRFHETSFGPCGFLSPDDIEIMERNQIGIQARDTDWLYIGRGLNREEPQPDGGTRGQDMDENHLRGFWRHYTELMDRS